MPPRIKASCARRRNIGKSGRLWKIAANGHALDRLPNLGTQPVSLVEDDQQMAGVKALKFGAKRLVKGEHTMYLIVEAGDARQLQQFLAPFEGAGSVEVYPASTCSGVVAAGGCGAPIPVSELVPALDPEVACQDAIESGLAVHRAHPLNCE